MNGTVLNAFMIHVSVFSFSIVPLLVQIKILSSDKKRMHFVGKKTTTTTTKHKIYERVM